MSKKRVAAYRQGLWAEYVAALFLFVRGYRIVAWRYKTRHGEVDLIASKGRTLVMLEVKRRQDKDTAFAAVTPRNQRRIEAAALQFLARNPKFMLYNVRFDVLAFSGLFSFAHLDNAWEARS